MDEKLEIQVEDYKSQKEIQEFQVLLLQKTLRPDLFVQNLKTFINNTIGPEFTKSDPFSLDAIFKESNAATPLIFILSPGNDPLNTIK